MATELPEARRGGAICLRLFGAPGRFAESLDNEALAANNGARYVITHLRRFAELQGDQIFIDVRKFLRRRRQRGEKVREFTIDWEYLHHTALAHEGIEIGDTL